MGLACATELCTHKYRGEGKAHVDKSGQEGMVIFVRFPLWITTQVYQNLSGIQLSLTKRQIMGYFRNGLYRKLVCLNNIR